MFSHTHVSSCPVGSGVARDGTSASRNVQLFVWVYSGIILVNVYTGFLVASITTYQASSHNNARHKCLGQSTRTFC